MELFGLHMPDMLVTAVTVLYWLAVALLACAMRGWLWGKWKWCLLTILGAVIITVTGLPHVSKITAVLFFIGNSCILLFVFKKWKNWNFRQRNISS